MELKEWCLSNVHEAQSWISSTTKKRGKKKGKIGVVTYTFDVSNSLETEADRSV